MVLVRRTALAGLVWLTAAMTLVAGFPHLDCRCPGGQLKRFCLGSSKGSACCCGGACCSGGDGHRCCCCSPRGPGAKSGQQAACCPHVQDTAPERRPADACRADSEHCVKSLASGELVALLPGKKSPTTDPSTYPDLGLYVPARFLEVRETGRSSASAGWPTCRSDDLLTRLQRLLI